MKVLAVLICVLLSPVSSQAPGDHNDFCRTGQQFQEDHVFPAEVKILLDGYDYISNSVWTTLSEDGDSINWGNSGGLCEWLWTRSCSGLTQQVLSRQDNWIFTQHVRYEAAKEVLFNVTFNFGDCDFNPCANDYVTLHIYQRNNIDSTGRTSTSNYQPLLSGTESRLQQPSGTRFQTTRTVRYARPPSSNGFYLGIRDEGTCGQVGRLIAHYLVCPHRVEGLVTYPETALPPQNSPDFVFDAVCASNADNTSSLQVRASSSGSCTALASGGPSCRCNAGYVLSGGGTTCTACSSGEYRTLSDTSCQQCPANTNLDVVAAPVCSCVDDFYRTPQEGPEVGCTEPPSRCTNLEIISRAATTITVRWLKPSTTGRSDFFYQIFHSDPDNLGTFILHNPSLIDDETTVTYTITGLVPFTDYILRITTNNGVSDQDSENDNRRVCEISSSTLEGVPGPPNRVQRLCTALLWQAPTRPNGVITRYELRFSFDSSSIVEVEPDVNSFVTDERHQSIGVTVQIRAATSAGTGEWTIPAPVCPTPCTLDPTVVSQTNASVTLMWNRISEDVTFSITVIDPDNPDTIVSSVDDIGAPSATVSYTVTDLAPFTTYRLMLTASGSSQGTDPITCMIVTKTTEGVSTAPARPLGVCTALVWRPPEQPNGVITGYSIRLSTGTEATLDPVDRHYEIERSDRKTGVTAQIRADNGAGPGVWTDNVSLGDCSEISTSSSSNLFSDSNGVELAIVAVCSIAGAVAIVVLIFVVIGCCLHKRANKHQPIKSSYNGNSFDLK